MGNYMQKMKMRYYIMIYIIKVYYASIAIYQMKKMKKMNYVLMHIIY